MSIPPAEHVAEAFDLGRPTGPMRAHRYGSSETWRLETDSGAFLVKRLWTGEDPSWRPALEAAMVFEGACAATGVSMPTPVWPVDVAFGCAARLPEDGVVRVYPWLEHRTVEVSDDLAEWLGTTLARLHRTAPISGSTPEPEWYGIFPAARWEAWLQDGVVQGRPWAAVLKERLPDVLRASRWVAEAFESTGPYVRTHRDVLPANVLVTAHGPVLVDFDTAGPDSAPLETATATLVFALRGAAEPDRDRVGRTLAAYEGEGGQPLPPREDLLARRLGMKLGTLSERLDKTLGHAPAGSWDLEPLSNSRRFRSCSTTSDAGPASSPADALAAMSQGGRLSRHRGCSH
ncbi:phosphotransferase enzyme family protein [Actinopolymorpha pittospori]|uniref:Ser/Thr protein kinase RdoA (MazF antagonist) n=1 Tax=Actinopolymorpha pittospori TaxID=648752 RepID=A0A927RB59_9ACTN|nr:phosphotransferase [Actinopolymorpha pittospori]MBE1608419.1 Ser/Thr protein kinase RdoA (MazF antagonist) [Actinopolymorpha pittospori]